MYRGWMVVCGLLMAVGWKAMAEWVCDKYANEGGTG